MGAVYRKLRLCSGGGGLEAIPDRELRLDLPRIRNVLRERGVPVVDARVMLIASLDPEVTIARTGRLLFKTGDSAAAERAFAAIRKCIDLAARGPE